MVLVYLYPFFRTVKIVSVSEFWIGLPDALSLGEERSVLSLESLTVSDEFWELVAEDLSLLWLDPSSWVVENIGPDSTNVEISHVELLAITDDPSFLVVWLHLLEPLWENSGERFGSVFLGLSSEGKERSMDLVEELLIPLDDIIVPVSINWFGWVQISKSANVSTDWIGLFHERAVGSNTEWQTTVLLFVSTESPSWNADRFELDIDIGFVHCEPELRSSTVGWEVRV